MIRLRWPGRLTLCLTLVASVCFGWQESRPTTGFFRKTFRDGDRVHRYAIYIPKGYSPEKSWPTILYLHTAGERGNDGVRPARTGLGPAISARAETFPFLAVFPQVGDAEGPALKGWLPASPDGKRALAILDEVSKEYKVDNDRVYLTGASMGGYGVWAHAAADPDRWAAIVPVCGGGDPGWAKKLGKLPVWCFHGTDDRAVLPAESTAMIEALKAAGAEPRYSQLDGVGHDAWRPAYGTDELYTWMLSHRRRASETAEPVVPATDGPVVEVPIPEIDLPQETGPFVSVLDISNAVSVRLGNDLLSVIGQSITDLVPKNALTGRLKDANTVSQSRVGPMQVQFRGLTYSASLGRANLTARQDGLVSATLRANNINIVINRTYISGSGRSATCGPMRVVLGNQRDLVLRCVVRPSVVNRSLQFKLVDVKFSIPPDNLSVTPPQWVNTSGLGMTEQRVSSGLVSGFYNDRSQFEKQIKNAIPKALDRLSENIPLERADRMIAEMWPLPVYKPRVKTWLSAVSVDQDGATISMGLSVAAVSPEQARGTPKVVELPLEDTMAASASKNFRFSIAPALLAHASEPLVEAGVARVQVTDSPLKALHALSDRDALSRIVPDVAGRNIERVRTELVLNSPISMATVNGEEDGEQLLNLIFKDIHCRVDIPAADGESWVPYLDIAFDIEQHALPVMSRATIYERKLSFDWRGDGDIEMKTSFVGETPKNAQIDEDAIAQLLATAWQQWKETGPLTKVRLPDISLGPNRVRAGKVDWNGSYVSLDWGPAGIVLINKTDQPVSYGAKFLFTDWGGPYELTGKKPHNYPVAMPFICRFNSGDRQKMYTLEVGRQYEFGQTAEGNLELFSVPDDRPYAGPAAGAVADAVDADAADVDMAE